MLTKNKIINLLVIVIILFIYLMFVISGISSLLPNAQNNNLNVIKNFEIQDNLTNGNGKTANVIILAGQSNADGVALNTYLQKNVSQQEYQKYQNGFDNVYINYFTSNGVNYSNGFVKTAIAQGHNKNYFGPELGIADKLNSLYPNQTFFIIKYSWGATNLCNQWRSPSSIGVTGEVYTAFKNFVNTSINYLISKNYNVKIKAMCWMQGESDSFNIQTAIKYKYYLQNLISDVRAEFNNHKADGGIKFIDAFIANTDIWKCHNIINGCKLLVDKKSKLNYCVDTISNGLTCLNEPYESPDICHYDSLSTLKLGHLFAEYI